MYFKVYDTISVYFEQDSFRLNESYKFNTENHIYEIAVISRNDTFGMLIKRDRDDTILYELKKSSDIFYGFIYNLSIIIKN